MRAPFARARIPQLLCACFAGLLAVCAAGAAEQCAPQSPCVLPAAHVHAEGGSRVTGGARSAALPGGQALQSGHDDDYLYRLPYGEAVSYPVLQAYGARFSHRGPEHFTVDFRMPLGTAVHAAREGVVVGLEDAQTEACSRDACSSLANYVVVLHADGTTGEYYHLDRGSVRVSVGEHVRRGQPIARSGNTGYSTVPHLHFGVYRRGADGTSLSLPVRFRTRTGAIAALRAGAHYFNVQD